MVNQSTQQFMYRVVILTVCIILVGSFAFMFVTAYHLGDGEAVRIIEALRTPILGAFGTLIAFMGGHQAMSTLIAKFTSNSGGAPAAPADTSTPSGV